MDTQAVKQRKMKNLDPEIYDLLDTEVVGRNCIYATVLCLICVVFMLIFTYGTAEEIVYLKKSERDGATVAFFTMSLSIGALLSPFILRRAQGRPIRMSKIVIAALLNTTVAMTVNGLLAFAPSVVKQDPIAGSRVYLVRWAEWIPMAGLMTFLSDVVSAPKKRGIYLPSIVAICQSVSCVPGILMPFTDSIIIWSALVCWSIGFYSTLFPRVWHKYKIIRDTDWEKYDEAIQQRHMFAFKLLAICTTLWAFLAFIFFSNIWITNNLPKTHVLRHDAYLMFVDATFDTVSKAFFARLVIDVHYAAFTQKQY